MVDWFRWAFAMIFLSTLGISAFYRRRARSAGETIARRAEGNLAVLLRLFAALPLFTSFTLYILNPGWMDWSALPYPPALRRAGVVVGTGCVPFLAWVFHTIGSNISETVLTKQSHQLVTGGPYHWVRHPLYSGALLEFLALSLVAANAFMGVYVILAALAFAFMVIPREEEMLLQKFGGQYQAYRQRTGRLLPKLF